MGGSGKSKQKKGKGKLKSKKSAYSYSHEQQPETCSVISNPNSDIKIRRNDPHKEDRSTPHHHHDSHDAIILNAEILKNKSYAEVENLLYNEIDAVYAQAFKKLVDLGYDGELAQKAILMNGHAFGNWNVLSNIVINSFSYISSGSVSEKCSLKDFNYLSDRVDDLLELMVELAQEAQPEWDRFDAIKHVLALTTTLGLATSMNLGSLQSGIRAGNVEEGSYNSNKNDLQSLDDSFRTEEPAEVSELPKRFGFSPGMESLLKQNAKTIAALYRPVDPDHASPAYHEAVDYLSSTSELECSDQVRDSDDYFLKQLAGCSESLNLEEWLQKSGGEDARNEVILNAVQHHAELVKQVQERREWACAKAMQAEEKLIRHVSELRMLRIEKYSAEERNRRKSRQEKKANSKILEKAERDLLKALDQLELATAAVRRLEMENAKIRAEKEAHLLSASLSRTDLQEVGKREKKRVKRGAAIEKERDQLQKQIEEQKQEVLGLNQELDRLRTKQKDAEEKWREQLKKKELAVALVAKEEERKEKWEADIRKKQSRLHEKMEMKRECMRNEVDRLGKELGNLKVVVDEDEEDEDSGSSSWWIELGFEMGSRDHESDTNYWEADGCSGSDGGGRKCMICSRNEVSVLFLPCAHQVVCTKCSENVGLGDYYCPCCHSKIEAKVTVFGGTTS